MIDLLFSRHNFSPNKKLQGYFTHLSVDFAGSRGFFMREKTPKTLEKLRERIDSIDNQVLVLLQERLACAKEIGRVKVTKKRAKWDPLRERQLFERLLKDNANAFPEQCAW